MIVRWNGREIGRGTHAAMIEETFVLPAGDLVRELNILEFELPDAVSPASLGLSPDPRRVGLALLSLRLD